MSRVSGVFGGIKRHSARTTATAPTVFSAPSACDTTGGNPATDTTHWRPWSVSREVRGKQCWPWNHVLGANDAPARSVVLFAVCDRGDVLAGGKR